MSGVANFLLTNSVTTGLVHGGMLAAGVGYLSGKEYRKENIVQNSGANAFHAYLTLRLVNNALSSNPAFAASIGMGPVSLWFAAVPLTFGILNVVAKQFVEDKKATEWISTMQEGLTWVLTAVSVASVIAAGISGQAMFAGVCTIVAVGSAYFYSKQNSGSKFVAINNNLLAQIAQLQRRTA